MVEDKSPTIALASTPIGTGPVASPRPSNAVVEPASAQRGTATLTGKEGTQADATVSRPATVMTNARGWMTFAVLVISWLLLGSVVAIFAKYWT